MLLLQKRFNITRKRFILSTNANLILKQNCAHDAWMRMVESYSNFQCEFGRKLFDSFITVGFYDIYQSSLNQCNVKCNVLILNP